jgi:predicted nucleotidyltransferase
VKIGFIDLQGLWEGLYKRGCLTLGVIPPVVLALLKMVAYLDDTHRHEKDLHDIRDVFRLYATDTDGEFSDEVFEANLPDVSLAPVFLLGVDLRSICSPDELTLVGKFATIISRVKAGNSTHIDVPPLWSPV